MNSFQLAVIKPNQRWPMSCQSTEKTIQSTNQNFKEMQCSYRVTRITCAREKQWVLVLLLIAGAGSKDYLDKLNRRAACIIEGRSIGAEELKSTLGWPSLQARRNYLKCLLVHKCLHGVTPSYLLSVRARAPFPWL